MKKAADLINTDFRLGVLGGGQLGKMMALAAGNWHLPITFLDTSPDFPAGYLGVDFVKGSFNDPDDVYNFGRHVDVLTIEIEHVNTSALQRLAAEGVIIHPGPDQLNIIKDKGLQKQFYVQKGLPTSPFELYADESEVRTSIASGTLQFPFVQKTRTAGYDGKGVAIIHSKNDLDKLLSGPCVIEALTDIEKELAVIVARNPSGAVKAFPTVEMEFKPEANLVEFLVCPAQIPEEIKEAAEALAIQTIEAFGLCGLLAVELFLTRSRDILINEVAPRPHNSGHHTIDSCYTSQFEQHLRAILDLPLGSVKLKSPSVMVNLLGAPGHSGLARYEGLSECLNMEGVNMHLYGKSITKPLRKMGHATILANQVEKAKEIARKVQQTLRIVSDT